MSSGNGTHDKPGQYRVADFTGLNPDQRRAALDSNEKDGYDLLAVDNNLAYLYKEDKSH